MKRESLTIGITLLFVGTIIPVFVLDTEKSLLISRDDWLSIGESGQGIYSKIQEAPMDAQCFGFLVNVTVNQSYGTQLNITRLLNALLNNNVSIYWITDDITLSVQGLEKGSGVENQTFQKGCFIIAFSYDEVINTKIIAQVYLKWLTSELSIYKIMQPLEKFTAYRLREPRIACYNCTSVNYRTYRSRLREAGFTNVDVLTAQQTIRNLTVDKYDIFIWGAQWGTYFETIHDTLCITGLRIRKHIREFIGAGGSYIGSCYGGWRAASGYQRPWGYPLDLSYSNLLNLVPMQLDLVKYNVYRALPGAGYVTFTIQNLTHPLAFGLPDHLSHLRYASGPLFISRRTMPSEKEIIGVLSDVNITQWTFDYMMDFVPFWNNRIISNTIKYKIAQEWMNDSIGAAMWIDGTFGKGKVILFGVHPESTYALGVNEKHFSPPRIIYNTIWYITAQLPFTFVLEIPVTYSTIVVDAGGPYIARVNQLIQVHGTALTGESPFNWYWEYGLTSHEYFVGYPYDNTREEQNPWFSFSNRGAYRIALVTTDALGNIGYDIATIKVN